MQIFYLWNEVSKLEGCISDLKEIIKWKQKQLRALQQWWFSDDVFEQKYLQDYIQEFRGNCLWYIWADRKKSKDKFLEENWLWTKKELAQFLCSKQWRYLADEEEKISIDMIKEYYESYLNVA